MKVLIGSEIFLDSDILLASDPLLDGALKLILRNTISIQDAVESRSFSSFTIIDIRNTEQYQKGQPVEIYDNDEELQFRGVIEDVTEKKIGTAGGLYHDIRCIDNNYRADKKIIAKAYRNQTVGDIVTDIFNLKLQEEGIEIGEIQQGPTLFEAVFNYVYVTDAFNSLAEKTGFWWNIGHDNKLYFVKRETYVAPFPVSGADMRKNSIQVHKGNPQYRNKQYIKGGKDITDPQTQVFVGDGENQTFTVGFPIATVPTVQVDSGTGYVAQTVGIRGLEEGKQWYWSKGENTITQDLEGTPLRKDIDRIKVIYQGEFDIVIISIDPTEIETRKVIESVGTGIVEDVFDDKTITTREAAFSLANAKIQKFARINTKVRFQTWKKGLKVGQIVTVDLPIHGINNQELLIERVTITTEGSLAWYDIEAVEGPSQQSWTKFFYDMATQRREFFVRENIQENEILVTLEQFSKTWQQAESPNIFDEVYAGETTLPGFLPMFDPADRVKYLAWYVDGVEVGRKPITRRTDGSADIQCTTFINALEANVTISHLGWWGGYLASAQIGTGVEIDKQAYVKQKTELEAIQIDKTDTINFVPSTGTLMLTARYFQEIDNSIEQLLIKSV